MKIPWFNIRTLPFQFTKWHNDNIHLNSIDIYESKWVVNFITPALYGIQKGNCRERRRTLERLYLGLQRIH